ncbi:MAG TPA: CapA family protein [Oscillatoriales cyanobacterium M59_W2019_021]|nr:CapA family protein [Oscillatoriales cyanobacterium M4454_W2019_049]HIK50139.1 CapA family protein [Oscillatoriales cyanobacterium M59_W2019_021]
MGDRWLQRFVSLGIIGFSFGSGVAYINRFFPAPSNASTVSVTPAEPQAVSAPPAVAPVANVPSPVPVQPSPALQPQAAPTASKVTPTATATPQPAAKTQPPTPAAAPATPSQPLPPFITIKAVGDVIPGTNYPDYRLPGDMNELLPTEVRGYLERAEIVFGNFESSLTNHPNSSKAVGGGLVFAFRSPPEYAQLFADAGFDIFNIANNHAMDFGPVGFQDTQNSLASVGIKTIGNKNQILYQDIEGIKVATIGFSPYEFYNAIQDLETTKSLVAEAKKNAQLVIVSMHSGAEGTGALHVTNETEFFFGENRGNSIAFARTAIDAGADLVLGHGPHVPRAIELYNGKIIAYSLGNFLGYRTLSTAGETGYSMILEVKLTPEGNFAGGRIIPVMMDDRGIPYIDQYFRTVSLVRYLSSTDFPESKLTIDRAGQLIVDGATSAQP